MVKRILKNTKFNQLDSFRHTTDETSDEDAVLVRGYYYVDIVWEEPNFYSDLIFTVELDPLTLYEEDEEDDKLLIPRDHESAVI
jgi:hypothetical protein